jgi:hypothetical protein
MPVAPLVDQFSVLFAPDVIVAGLAPNELITGLPPVTVTVRFEVDDPAEFVAVSVYIVVAVGLTFIEPLEDLDVNVPGVTETLVAPVADQLSVVVAPEFTDVGLAAKEVMLGMAPVPEAGFDPPPQFKKAAQADKTIGRKIPVRMCSRILHCPVV